MRGGGPERSTWGARFRSEFTPEFAKRARRRRIARRLLRGEDEDEVIVDKVYHHWVVYLPSLAEVVLAAVLTWFLLGVSTDVGWVLIVLVAGLLAHAAWLWTEQFMDVFVITNVRVLRVSGIVSLKQASTPLGRILDITLDQPFLGRLLQYGHFVFESAAQDQGLRDIRYVAEPLRRDQEIQNLQMKMLTGRKIEGTSPLAPGVPESTEASVPEMDPDE